MISGVDAVGLKEFRRGLNRIDPELTKQLRRELLEIGQDVANDARMTVPVGRTGRARGSVRAGVSGNNAYIAGGKATVPYFGWLDFGSRTPRSGRPRSVGPWKGTGPGPYKGRFIYPAIARNQSNIERRAVKAFEKARDEALKST